MGHPDTLEFRGNKPHERIGDCPVLFVDVSAARARSTLRGGARAEMCLRREELICARGDSALGHRTSDVDAAVAEFSCE